MKSLKVTVLIAVAVFVMAASCAQVIQTHVADVRKKHGRCDMCHVTAEPRKGQPLFAEGTDPSVVCLRCHAYARNHHPVDMVPPEYFDIASQKTFPLFRGEIRCLTCHDPHGGAGLTETSGLLRGGPYGDRRALCFACHRQESYAGIDPHIMLDRNGRIIEVNNGPVCLVCHSKTPDPQVDRTNDVRFRADVAFLCWRCHPPMPGEFFGHHFLVKPSAGTIRIMKRAERDMGVILPLVPRGRITCSTCHNPHQKEVMVHAPARTGADSLYRLRLQPSIICTACHSTK